MSANRIVSHPDLEQPANQPPAEPALTTDASANQEAKLYAGRYATVEDLEAAKLASDAEVTNKLLPKIQQQEQMIHSLLGQQAKPAHQKDAFAELDELGIPSEVTRRAVRDVVQEALAPIMRAVQAQSELAVELPDYAKVAPDVQRFIAASPELKAELELIPDPKVAAKYAFTMFRAAQGARQTAADPARGAAAIPTSQANARTPDNGAAAHAERFNRELAELREGGGDEFLAFKAWNNARQAERGTAIHPFIQPS